MKKIASVAVCVVALASAAFSTRASAQTFYKLAPAVGTVTGTVTFYDSSWPLTCSLTSPWNISGGTVNLSSVSLSGAGCHNISFAVGGNLMIAHAGPTSPNNAAIHLVWVENFTTICTNAASGFFDNATQGASFTGPGAGSCRFDADLSFPTLQLLP